MPRSTTSRTGSKAGKKPKSATRSRSRPKSSAAKAKAKGGRGRKKSPGAAAALRVLAIATAAGGMAVVTYWAAKLTFTPIDDNGQAVGNTDVGRSLRFYLDRPSIKEAARQIGGNLVLLAPFGVLLPVVFGRLRGLLRIAVAAVVISLTVETVQGALVPGRAFDVDDVILNATGVVSAYVLIGARVAGMVRGRREPSGARR